MIWKSSKSTAKPAAPAPVADYDPTAPESGRSTQRPPLVTPIGAASGALPMQRPSTLVYAGCPANIKSGGAEVANIASGGQAVFDVPAGETAVTASCWSYPGNFTLKFKAEAGRSYALEVGPRQNSIGTAVVLGAIGGAIEASVAENTGAFELKAAAMGAG